MATMNVLDSNIPPEKVEQAPVPEKQTRWRLGLGDLPLSIPLCFGVSILAIFTLVAIFGPLFVHGDPNAMSSNSLAAPSAQHWLGTTSTGQDVLAQLVVGARLSMLIGFSAGAVATLLSVIIGVAGGYFGGWIGELLSLLANIFLVLPGLPVAVLLSSTLAGGGPLPIILIISITGWAWGARVLRAQTLTLRDREFIQAARTQGESTFRIMFFEILPNLATIVLSNFIFAVIYAILTEAGLEFLGVSNTLITSWGTMLYWAQNSETLLQAWWWFLPPGLCIALLGAALAFINFSLDTVVNPRLRVVRVDKALLAAQQRNRATHSPRYGKATSGGHTKTRRKAMR